MSDPLNIRFQDLANEKPCIQPWMRRVLTFAGWYNIVAGLAMMILYHEGFKMLGVAKPDMNLPIQLVGLLVALFGVGYLIAASNPVENRNLILIGMFSKLLGPLLAVGYIVTGQLPTTMIPVLIFADIIYLVPFWAIYQQSRRIAQKRLSYQKKKYESQSNDLQNQFQQLDRAA